jgi:trans-2,3-dihydro-3-hydroxyanthranilate isomerase
MRRCDFIQLDVFTSVAFGGNQLAVFPHADELSEREMQAIAREMNYSETTFVVDATEQQAHCRVRIFTPQRELPFAGHPVIGTTFALARSGRLHEMGSPIYLQLRVGIIAVDVLYEERRPSFVWMHQPAPSFESWRGDHTQLAAALSLSADDLEAGLPIERGTAGVAFLYVPVRSMEALARACPTPQLGEAMGEASGEFDGHPAVYVFAPTNAHGTGVAEIRARMFAPEMGVVEDAATGSAAGPLGAYLVRHKSMRPDADGETRIRIEQGIEMGRPSHISVVVIGEPEQIREVRVGGEAVTVAEGELFLP